METLPDLNAQVIYRGQTHWVKAINPAVDDEVQIATSPDGHNPRWVSIAYLTQPTPYQPRAKSPSQVRDKMTTGEVEALCRAVASVADALGVPNDNWVVNMARRNVVELDLWRKHQA